MKHFIERFKEIILLIPDCNHTQHSTLSLSMGYNGAHVIIGDLSEKRFLRLTETPPMLRRAAWEHRRASAMDHQTIGDIIKSNMHR